MLANAQSHRAQAQTHGISTRRYGDTSSLTDTVSGAPTL